MNKYYVWLSLALGTGNIRAANALKYYKNAENIYHANYDERKNSKLFTVKELEMMKKITLTEAIEITEYCKNHKIDLIPYGDNKYPYCLSVIDNPPIVLYVKGKLPDFDNVPAICIVGPREVTDYGKRAAFSLGYRLALSGMTVVSGGAVGTDYQAHAGALKAKGKTVLVMGCGIDSNYLPENSELRAAVSKTGCLISEYAPKTSTTRFSFPVRNRIMSALSVGTVVVEAGKRSGALITARHAAEQGRDVFVIPGNPNATEYMGSNALLRDGAKPLLDVSDIFNEYIPSFPDKIDVKRAFEKYKDNTKNTNPNKINRKILNETLSNEAKIVYNHLDKHKFYPEEIKDTGLSSEQLLSALTELEIEFVIKALPGGRYEMCDN